MKFIIAGRKLEITEALKAKINSKFAKLDKFFHDDSEVHVTLSAKKDRNTVEATIYHNGMIFRAEETTNDMYMSIDKIIDILERQIRKNKTRLEKKLRENAFDHAIPKDFHDVQEEKDFRIVRSKKFAMKPMSVEEAVLQMNLLGHQFYVFFNADTEEVDVVYKRKEGDYGLIEPEF